MSAEKERSFEHKGIQDAPQPMESENNFQKQKLQVTEFNPLSKEYPNEHWYHLEIPNEYVGVAFVSPKGLALIWEGKLDLENIEQDAIEGFSGLVFQRPLNTENMKDRKGISVSFTLEKDEDTVPLLSERAGMQEIVWQADKYIDGNLADAKTYASYQQALQMSDKIIRARYDIEDTIPEVACKYTITAERGPSGVFPVGEEALELSIKLPREQAWPQEIVSWVIDHHVRKPQLRKMLDQQQTAGIINRLAKRKS